MEIILFLAGVFLAVFILGRILEKVRIPWVFSALIIGMFLAAYNPFTAITSSETFIFLAELGMFFLLFIIGFELNIGNIKRQGKFIIKLTSAIILTETFFGALLVHFVFGTPWLISILVALSFATIGEAMLLPILDEFRLTRTKFGQAVLGVGVLDDIVEIITIIIAVILIGKISGQVHINIWLNLIILTLLFVAALVLPKIIGKKFIFKIKDSASFFLIALFLILLFVGVGKIAGAEVLGALLAGAVLKNMVPADMVKKLSMIIRAVAYGFLAPIFFLWVGLDTDMAYIIKFPYLVLLIIVVVKFAKILTTYLVAKNVFGPKKSILMGVSFCVKFSTSIVIIKLLFENGLIGDHLYSVLIGATVIFKGVVPFVMAVLIRKWKLKFRQIKTLPA